MAHADTRQRYARRIELVVEHLVERLDQPLTLEHLAAIGHFSPHHFHRIYRGMMGETINGTIQRMRLHRAAIDLARGDRTLDSIARAAGFGSRAAFTRAFSQAYGVPPGRFRRRHDAAIPFALRFPSTDKDHPMYTAKIEQRDSIRVAALRHVGDYQQIGDSFQKLAAWVAGHGIDPMASRSFGIYYDDPEAKPQDELLSDACIEIPASLQARAPVESRTIAGGRYAVAIHTGPYAELERAYRWLFSEWLPASGEEAADAPMVEEYLNDPQRLPPTEWRTAVCLPLRKGAST